MADTKTKKGKADRPAPHDFPSSPETPAQDPDWERAGKPDLSPEERMQGIPQEQLRRSIDAVFESWDNDRAVTYRKLNDIRGLHVTRDHIQAAIAGALNQRFATIGGAMAAMFPPPPVPGLGSGMQASSLGLSGGQQMSAEVPRSAAATQMRPSAQSESGPDSPLARSQRSPSPWRLHACA